MDRPGKENQFVYFLSRLNIEGENIHVNDEFIDEHLIVVSTYTPWFADMANYLAIENLPQHLSFKQKQSIFQLSVNYSWMERDLYHTGKNLIICIFV